MTLSLRILSIGVRNVPSAYCSVEIVSWVKAATLLAIPIGRNLRRIGLAEVGFAHTFGFALEESIFDGLSDEVGTLAVGRWGNPIDLLVSLH